MRIIAGLITVVSLTLLAGGAQAETSDAPVFLDEGCANIIKRPISKYRDLVAILNCRVTDDFQPFLSEDSGPSRRLPRFFEENVFWRVYITWKWAKEIGQYTRNLLTVPVLAEAAAGHSVHRSSSTRTRLRDPAGTVLLEE